MPCMGSAPSYASAILLLKVIGEERGGQGRISLRWADVPTEPHPAHRGECAINGQECANTEHYMRFPNQSIPYRRKYTYRGEAATKKERLTTS